MAEEPSPEALALHHRSLVIDNLVTGPSSERTLDNLRAGGVRAGNWTVAGHTDSFEGALMKMEERRWMFAKYPEKAALALCAADVERISSEGRFAAFFGFQTTW